MVRCDSNVFLRLLLETKSSVEEPGLAGKWNLLYGRLLTYIPWV